MRLDTDVRAMLRSKLAAAGPTSRTDEDATTEEWLAMALDDLDEAAAVVEAAVEWKAWLADALRDPVAWRAVRPEARHSAEEWERMNYWAADVVCSVLDGAEPVGFTARALAVAVAVVG